MIYGNTFLKNQFCAQMRYFKVKVIKFKVSGLFWPGLEMSFCRHSKRRTAEGEVPWSCVTCFAGA